jgi:hypothetical protein
MSIPEVSYCVRISAVCRGFNQSQLRLFAATHENFNFDCYEGEMLNPVVHFEFPYDNPLRMVKFYETVFGWRTQKLGEETGN